MPHIFENMITGVKESIVIERVFGAPVEREGVTRIPVAWSVGAAGGGGGTGPTDEGGSGGGFVSVSFPSGVYVIKDGTVRWRPIIDPNTLIKAAVGVLTLIVRMRLARRRRAARKAD